MTLIVESFEGITAGPNSPMVFPGAFRVGATGPFRFASGLTLIAPVPSEHGYVGDHSQGFSPTDLPQAADVPSGSAWMELDLAPRSFGFEVPVYSVSITVDSDDRIGLAAFDSAGSLIIASQVRKVGPADWDTNVIQVLSRVPIAKITVFGDDTRIDDVAFDTAKPHVVNGSKHNDKLGFGHAGGANPTDGAEFINGKGGNDRIKAKAGDDTIDAGKGKDKVDGGDGNDSIIGGDGADALTGGAGQDTFLFGRLGWIDKLKDFLPFDDTILLQKIVFDTPSVGHELPEATLRIGPAAADADDRIIYDFNTGKLSYDLDGTGPIAPIQFAQLPIGLALTTVDFLMV